MIKIIATLCALSTGQCQERLVTSSEFQPLGMADCNNMAALAEWMKAFPAYRLQGWRCQLGERPERHPA